MTGGVVGLDLSITATGVARKDGTTFTIRPGAGDRRLVEIRDGVCLALEGGCDLVVIEDLPTNAKSAGITGMVHGAVRAALIMWCVPYVLVTPATLKKYATGRGNADKTAMTMALFKRTGLELADDNQVDAAWLRFAGLQLLGEPAVDLPAAQVAALEVIQWP